MPSSQTFLTLAREPADRAVAGVEAVLPRTPCHHCPLSAIFSERPLMLGSSLPPEAPATFRVVSVAAVPV